jgi:hypothetical protein
MTFRDFMDLDGVRMDFPIHGHVYSVPPMMGEHATRARAAMAGTAPEIPRPELRVMALGSVLEEMTANDVPLIAVDRAVMTVLTDLWDGREAAEVMWATGGDEALVAEWVAQNTPADVPAPPAKKAPAKKAPAKKAASRAAVASK